MDLEPSQLRPNLLAKAVKATKYCRNAACQAMMIQGESPEGDTGKNQNGGLNIDDGTDADNDPFLPVFEATLSKIFEEGDGLWPHPDGRR